MTTTDLPKPAGFPNCNRCPFVTTGTPAVCMACAHQTLQHPVGDTCEVCAQELDTTGRCRNRVCSDVGRSIDHIEAIAVYSEPLKTAILRLKDSDRHYGWAPIFGRLVLGHINVAALTSGARYGAIVANPGYKPDGSLGHTELVVAAASVEDVYNNWNFQPEGLTLSGPKTPHGKSMPEKMAAADEIYQLLEISDSLDVIDLSVLVYDDVCTTGGQMDTVARFLVDKGAGEVVGLALARTPWTY